MESTATVETVDGPGAIRWMHQVVAHVAAREPREYERRTMAVAGVHLDLNFDDPVLADEYCSIMYHQPVVRQSSTRVYVLTSARALATGFPDLDRNACSPEQFQELARTAGLRAAYPFQPQTWKFFDLNTRIGVQLTASRQCLPLWDATAPLRHHLHWILDERGERLAHAATLGHEGQGVILFGAGGAGKSGTTLAGLSVGLKTVGDDYVALSVLDQCFARPLYRVVKQDRAGLARHPTLNGQTAHIPENWRGKVMFDPNDFYAEPFVDALQIGAIVLPHIAHADEPALRPAKAREAMLSLMTSNLHQFPAEHEVGMAFYARLLRQLPCFHLDLSDNAQKNGALIKDFIARGGGQRVAPQPDDRASSVSPQS